MINFKNIKGIIFDYGATLDSNGNHWSNVIWHAYKTHHIPVTKKKFLKSYAFSEKFLTLTSIVKFQDNFQELLLKKTNLQISWLIKNKYLPERFSLYSSVISTQCNNFVLSILKNDVLPILKVLYKQYELVLVSNFYGNIKTVLKEFKLDIYFKSIIESANVKIRKPDLKIFELGIKALNLKPNQIVVIGDSYENDIFPSKKLGCYTIWLKKSSYDKQRKRKADLVIADFKELKILFK